MPYGMPTLASPKGDKLHRIDTIKSIIKGSYLGRAKLTIQFIKPCNFTHKKDLKFMKLKGTAENSTEIF